MNWRYGLLTAAAVCVAAAASYAAFHALGSRSEKQAEMAQASLACGALADHLQLTPAQLQSIGEIDRRMLDERSAAQDGMRKARAALLEVLESEQPTSSEIETALADVSGAQSRMQRLTAHYILQLKPILSAQQRDRLFEFVGQKFCLQGGCGAGMCPAGKGAGGQHRRGWAR